MHRMSLLLAALGLCAPALAAPAFLPVQGVLSDAEGTPLDGDVAITFRLTRDPDGLDELFAEAQTVDVQAGSFSVHLGDVEPLDLSVLSEEAEVWLQLQIEGDEPMNPVRLGPSVWAGSADRAFEADTLQGASLEDILGQIPADDAIESLAMGVCYDDVAELRTALDAVYMATGDDVDWSQLLNVPADLGDGDDDTLYAAGTGLVLSGTTFSTDDAHINALAQDVVDAPGSLDVAMVDYLATYGVSFDELTDVPEGLADGDDDTTYEAAADGGLLLDAGGFSIDRDLLDTWVLETAGISGTFDDTVQSYLDTVGITGSVDDAIQAYLDGIGITGSVDDAIAAYLLSTPVGWSDLSDIPADLADGDDDTTYTAGSGLSLTDTTFALDYTPAWSELTGVPADLADGDDDTTYTAGSGLSLTDTTFALDYTPAWSELTGVPADLADGDDDTTYTAGSGLSLSGTELSADWSAVDARIQSTTGISGSVDDSIATHLDGIGLTGSVDDAIGDYLAANPTSFDDLTDVPAGLSDGDDDTLYSAGNGLVLSGTSFALDETIVRDLAADEVASTSLSGLEVDGDMEVTGQLLGAAQNTAGSALRICTGESNDVWTSYGSGGLVKTISMSGCGFTSTPVIISSLHGTSSHWTTTGGQNVYSPTSSQFTIYISGGSWMTTTTAATYDWHIEWVAIGQ